MSNEIYTYINTKGTMYYLNTQEVDNFDGKRRSIYYFSKDQRPTACGLPEGRMIVENPKTGLPFLRKDS